MVVVAERALDRLDALEKRADRILAMGERIEGQAEQILDLGERITTQAQGIGDLGERISGQAESMTGLGERMLDQGVLIEQQAHSVVARAGELVEALPTIEQAVSMVSPLEGAVERIGRAVDRLPGGVRRAQVAAEQHRDLAGDHESGGGAAGEPGPERA